MQTPENHLVCQLQTAHRLCAGFYNMFFHSLFNAVEREGFIYSFWSPTETDPPHFKDEDPRKHWEWDYIPVYASQYAFLNYKYNDSTRKENRILIVKFYMDESFSSSNRTSEEKPDPLEGEPGKAILQIGLYRPVDTKKATFEELWKQSEYPEEEESWGPVTEGPSVEACFKMVFLEDFIRNPGIITEWIQNAMRKAC